MHYIWSALTVCCVIYVLDGILGRPFAVIVVSAAFLLLVFGAAIRRTGTGRRRDRYRDLTY